MKKSTKGAVAAAAAGVLLLGGAGTLAFWTAEDTVNGGSVTAGTLDLTAQECSTGGWVYAEGNEGAGDPVNLFVPGDVVTKDCTFTIGASGDNLEAVLGAPETVTFETSGDAVLTAAVDTTYTIDGVAAADEDLITSDNDGDEVVVTFLVDIDYGTADEPDADPPVTGVNGNATQGVVASLDDLTVTLTQTDPNP